MKLSAKKEELLEDVTVYRCIVGSLIYMTITKPNLSYVMGLVSHFIQVLRKPHLDAAYIEICEVHFALWTFL